MQKYIKCSLSTPYKNVIRGKINVLLFLGGCSYENGFPIVFSLKKILFPCVYIQNISPPGRDLFWWENFERSQYAKSLT